MLLLSAAFGYSQKDSCKRKYNYYAMWGYNREVYTTSTLHFVNNESGVNEYGTYDFKVTDVRAHDKPDFEELHDVINITIPQYNARVGVWLNNSRDEGFELSFDHTKYVVTDYQTARFVGDINGVHVDKDSVLNPDYFHFEHTDGANFLMANYMRRFKLVETKQHWFDLSYVIKPGFGVVIPRTDVTLFGKHLNNDFKVAGICAGFETSIRAEVKKHVVVEFAGKAGWANYINSLVLGRGHGKASHKFGFLEGILCIGYQL